MKKKASWDLFLEFECKYRMFDFVDNDGHPVWDLVRDYVYSSIVSEKKPHPSASTLFLAKVKSQICSIPYALQWLFSSHKKYLFYMASRNLIEGKLVDINAVAPIETLGYDNCYLMESYADVFDSRLYYSRRPSPTLTGFLSCFVRKKYDFSNVINIVKSTFPSADIDVSILNRHYKNFYSHYIFFKLFLKRRRFEKIFVVQNGYQKGLYRAASELGIPVIELQHGYVSKAHMAYSYPEGYENLIDKMYNPNMVLSYGSFWFSNVFNPKCRFIPVGNNFLAPEISRSKVQPFSFLIVSESVFGKSLKDLVLQFLEYPYSRDAVVYFKLHPNEFWQYDKYVEAFKKYPQVKVVSNQMGMQQLLNIVESVILIQSTAAYEALYFGVKVFVYKRFSYEMNYDIKEHEGVYFIDNTQDLINSYELSKDVVMIPDDHYFSRFNKEAFLEAINE